jgi:hypothetical protein
MTSYMDVVWMTLVLLVFFVLLVLGHRYIDWRVRDEDRRIARLRQRGLH